MTRKVKGELASGFNPGVGSPKPGAKSSKGAQTRIDGELYARPEPNPFTAEWMQGYDDGLELMPYKPPLTGKPQNYRDGYNAGEVDREELDRAGSSNA